MLQRATNAKECKLYQLWLSVTREYCRRTIYKYYPEILARNWGSADNYIRDLRASWLHIMKNIMAKPRCRTFHSIGRSMWLMVDVFPAIGNHLCGGLMLMQHIDKQFDQRIIRCMNYIFRHTVKPLIARWRCSNYIFNLDLTPGFNGFGKHNCKTRRELFEFWDLMRLILNGTTKYVNGNQNCLAAERQNLSRCCPNFVAPYGVTMPQWINQCLQKGVLNRK